MILNVGAGGATDADKIKYDNSKSSLESDNVQGAVDELNESLETDFINLSTLTFQQALDQLLTFENVPVGKTKTFVVSTSDCGHQLVNASAWNGTDWISGTSSTVYPTTFEYGNYTFSRYVAGGASTVIRPFKHKEAISLVPYLTSYNGSDGGEAFASSEYQDYKAWKAFSNSVLDFWHATSKTSQYIGYKFTKPTCVVKICIRNRHDSSQQTANTIQLQGSNNGSSWNNIGDSLTNSSNMGATTYFEVDNSDYYTHYRINILEANGNGLVIGQLQFYGHQKEA